MTIPKLPKFEWESKHSCSALLVILHAQSSRTDIILSLWPPEEKEWAVVTCPNKKCGKQHYYDAAIARMINLNSSEKEDLVGAELQLLTSSKVVNAQWRCCGKRLIRRRKGIRHVEFTIQRIRKIPKRERESKGGQLKEILDPMLHRQMITQNGLNYEPNYTVLLQDLLNFLPNDGPVGSSHFILGKIGKNKEICKRIFSHPISFNFSDKTFRSPEESKFAPQTYTEYLNWVAECLGYHSSTKFASIISEIWAERWSEDQRKALCELQQCCNRHRGVRRELLERSVRTWE